MKQEANIKLSMLNGKVIAISVNMPIWNKVSDHGNLLVSLPFLGIDTIAKDEADSEKAIQEAIVSFCVVSEKFGQGAEKELEALGWIRVDGETGEPLLGYNISTDEDVEGVLERIVNTGENYVNPHLEIA